MCRKLQKAKENKIQDKECAIDGYDKTLNGDLINQWVHKLTIYRDHYEISMFENTNVVDMQSMTLYTNKDDDKRDTIGLLIYVTVIDKAIYK